MFLLFLSLFGNSSSRGFGRATGVSPAVTGIAKRSEWNKFTSTRNHELSSKVKDFFPRVSCQIKENSLLRFSATITSFRDTEGNGQTHTFI
jgi:hypothetical protein